MGSYYGLAWNPHGTYAKELTFLMRHVGFTPLEAIKCATNTGAEILPIQRIQNCGGWQADCETASRGAVIYPLLLASIFH
jgi:hypothetical protein